MWVAITQSCPGLFLGALCIKKFGYGEHCRRPWHYHGKETDVQLQKQLVMSDCVLVPGVGSRLCLQNISSDLRPYTRSCVFLVVQV